jgi:hypothetical protein
MSMTEASGILEWIIIWMKPALFQLGVGRNLFGASRIKGALWKTEPPRKNIKRLRLNPTDAVKFPDKRRRFRVDGA